MTTKAFLAASAFAAVLAASATAAERPSRGAAISAPVYIFPATANATGQFNAVFRTRLTIANPSALPLNITAELYSDAGLVGQQTIELQGNHTRNYDNALADIFGFSGGAALVLSSPSNLNVRFAASAEVYVDGANGRFSTAVEPILPIDYAGSAVEGTFAYSTGVLVDVGNRSNAGCVNLSGGPVTVTARVTPQGPGGIAQTLGTLNFNLATGQRTQQGIGVNVNRGTIVWQASKAGVFCFAVNVNNASNDGSLLPAQYDTTR